MAPPRRGSNDDINNDSNDKPQYSMVRIRVVILISSSIITIIGRPGLRLGGGRHGRVRVLALEQQLHLWGARDCTQEIDNSEITVRAALEQQLHLVLCVAMFVLMCVLCVFVCFFACPGAAARHVFYVIIMFARLCHVSLVRPRVKCASI